jgi:hypothetical protein
MLLANSIFKPKLQLLGASFIDTWSFEKYHPITYSWTVPLILDRSYLLGNLRNSKIAETKALDHLKS